MGSFVSLDATIIIVLIISFLTGLLRGFTKEFFSLLIWVVAFVVATSFASDLANQFVDVNAVQGTATGSEPAFASGAAHDNTLMFLAVSYVSLFFGTLLVGTVAIFYVGQMVKNSEVSIIARLLGGIVGCMRGVCFVFLMLFLLDFFPLSNTLWISNSSYAIAFQPYIKVLDRKVDSNLEELKEKSHQATATPHANFLQGIGGPGI